MSWMPPTNALIEEARHLTRHPQLYRRFFEQLENPLWFQPLRDLGYFNTPPGMVTTQDEECRTWWPDWPETKYLIRIATTLPAETAEILTILGQKSENPHVHIDIMDAASRMPTPYCAHLALNEARWLRRQPVLEWLLPDHIIALAQHLAESNEGTAAVAVCRSLFDLRPDPRSIEERTVAPEMVFPPEPQPRCDPWKYSDAIKKVLPCLIRNCGWETLIMFSEVLYRGIRHLDPGRASPTTKLRAHDGSWVWRPAIEDHTQNTDFQILSPLASAVRDIANSLMPVEGQRTLEYLEQQRYAIFHRVALHLRREWPSVGWSGTQALITDPEVFHDLSMHHEVYRLLEDRFAECDEGTKTKYFELVDGGPLQNREDQERVAWWTYRKLLPVSRYLTGARKDQLHALQARLGPFEHPEFHSWTESWTGPTSPKQLDDLTSMPLADLLQFLHDWKASGREMDPSPEGLGRNLAEVVRSRPSEFAMDAEAFCGLDPTYVRPLLSGLADAVSKGEVIEWAPVLSLCAWVTKQPRNLSAGRSQAADIDPDWGWTRKAVGYLLRMGFSDRPGAIPIDQRQIAWSVLELLTEDPEPTAEYEATYGGQNSDPVSLSINTVRGEALHAVVAYCDWVRRNEPRRVQSGKGIEDSRTLPPEARRVLEAHLDPARDPSTTVRSVYGHNIELLFDLDPAWTRSNLESVFGGGVDRIEVFEAAWYGYLSYARMQDELVALLSAFYRKAIERLGLDWSFRPLVRDPEETLAEHLVLQFIRGVTKLEENDSLICEFYRVAPLALRRHALSYAGRCLAPLGPRLAPEARARLTALWNRRLAHAKEHLKEVSEIEPFGWWLASESFESKWALEQAIECIAVARSLEPDFLVVEKIATWCLEYPLLVAQCLERILMSTQHGWSSIGWSEHTRSILETLLRDGAPELRERAERLINELGARGYLQYRDLLPSGSG